MDTVDIKALTLTISTTDRRFSIKLPEEECRRRFGELVLLLAAPKYLDRYDGELGGIEPDDGMTDEGEPESGPSDYDRPIPTNEPYVAEMSGPVHMTEGTSPGYKGFLFVECEHCGESFGFCARDERTAFKCRTCDNETQLTNMVPMRAYCQCGKRSNYLTNCTKSMYDVQCIECKGPVAVEYVGKRGGYETIRN